MGHSKRVQLILSVIFVILLLILVAPKTHSQVPGQPADKDQATMVLRRLIDRDLVGLEILLGDQITPGTFNLVFADGEKSGRLVARCVGDAVWLESLTLTPSTSVIKPSISDVSLRTKLYLFFGNGQAGWHDGTQTKSVDRQDVWVQRSSRYDDGLVIQFSYGNWYPTLLFDLKVINWPAPPQ